MLPPELTEAIKSGLNGLQARRDEERLMREANERRVLGQIPEWLRRYARIALISEIKSEGRSYHILFDLPEAWHLHPIRVVSSERASFGMKTEVIHYYVTSKEGMRAGGKDEEFAQYDLDLAIARAREIYAEIHGQP